MESVKFSALVLRALPIPQKLEKNRPPLIEAMIIDRTTVHGVSVERSDILLVGNDPNPVVIRLGGHPKIDDLSYDNTVKNIVHTPTREASWATVLKESLKEGAGKGLGSTSFADYLSDLKGRLWPPRVKDVKSSNENERRNTNPSAQVNLLLEILRSAGIQVRKVSRKGKSHRYNRLVIGQKPRF